ncbi:TrbI/VirB10 family protein [Caulobacter segnis]|uniref:TrbI/VirB10 family protein n=1 Tax=Caulobacter segnis TaxID=88688 RepID=UPI00240F6D17|nr:TrbI/VirB10 family protein [Caulobacter segnis]MDG2522890.1 TrbI/VirB10 family protein [Caulobacter segnis]
MPDDADQDIREAMRLRETPSGIPRLNRKLMITLVSGGMLACAGLVGYGLTTQRKASAQAKADIPVQAAAPAEAVSGLPSSYAKPNLGPPLPGDVGVAMHAMQTDAAAMTRVSTPSTYELPAVSLESEGLFFKGVGLSDQKASTPSASGVLLVAGSVIPAALVTAVQADMAGPVVAQTVEPVFDSATGRILLIPAGTRLLGDYAKVTGYGQSRIGLVWRRLLFADGKSVELDAAGGDREGRGGLTDQVDRHWGRLLATTAVSTLLGVGGEARWRDASDDAALVGRAFAAVVNDSGQQLVARELDVKPTLRLRVGLRVNAVLNKDLHIQPKELVHGEAEALQHP